MKMRKLLKTKTIIKKDYSFYFKFARMILQIYKHF